MTLLINSYSFVIIGLLILLVIALLIWQLVNPKWAVVTVTVTFVFLVVFQSMASTKINTVSSPKDFDDVLASEKPVLVELYSNF